MDWKKLLIVSSILLICFVVIYFGLKLLPFIKAIGSFLLQLLLPFVIAGFFAYLLYPIVVQLERWHIQKSFALFFIYLLFFVGLFFVGSRGLPVLYNELQDLSIYLPELIDVYEQLIYSLHASTAFLPEAVHEQIDELIIDVEIALEQQLENILHHFLHAFDYLFTVILIPVILFYLLKDYERLKQYMLSVIPNKYRKRTLTFLNAFHIGLGNYLRGQLIVSSLVFTFTYIVYHFLGLRYAFALSLFTGLMNIIPYFGPIIGMIPAVLIAFASSFKLVIFVIVTIIAIQIIEGVFLSPYVMGKSVRLHPLVIIFVLICSAKIGGFFVMIIAIPFVTIARAVWSEFTPRTELN